MDKFNDILKAHRLRHNIDIDLVGKKAKLNFQTVRLIESGKFEYVKAKDLLSYLRVMGFKISAGKPRL